MQLGKVGVGERLGMGLELELGRVGVRVVEH